MKEVRKLITDLAFNYYEHGSKLDTIIPEADIDPIIKYIGDNFVSRVELPSSVAEPNQQSEKRFTLQEILNAVRKELIESFGGDYDASELKDKIYTVHGYIINAVRNL